MIAVGVLGSLGDEHDPVLDLGHPGIHSVAGALTAIADHTNLDESEYRHPSAIRNILYYLFNIDIYYLHYKFNCVYSKYFIFVAHLPFSETISGPPESPSHESVALLLSPAQMW